MDSNRTMRIKHRLNRLSVVKRKEQLKKAAEPLIKRNLKLTLEGKIPLNKAGTRTGMHNRDNSEHMKKIRGMRKIYNRAMPVLACDSCAFSSSCPQKKAGHECAFLPFLNSHRIDNEEDLMEAMKNLCEASMSRVHRQAMMETLTGGMPSMETSEAFNLAFGQLKMLHDKMQDSNTINAKIETEDGTIIGRLFGGLENLIEDTQDAHEKPVDVPPMLTEIETLALPAPKEEINQELIKEHSTSELEHLTSDDFRSKKRSEPRTVRVGDIKI